MAHLCEIRNASATLACITRVGPLETASTRVNFILFGGHSTIADAFSANCSNVAYQPGRPTRRVIVVTGSRSESIIPTPPKVATMARRSHRS